MEEPEKMKTVGQNAMERIYLSWEDSVKNAVERYKTVLENYREGKYRREQTFSDEWLDAEGEILDAMCRIKNNGIRIKNEAENYGKKFYKKSVYTAKKIDRKRKRIKAAVKTKQKIIRESLLEKFDRYL